MTAPIAALPHAGRQGLLRLHRALQWLSRRTGRWYFGEMAAIIARAKPPSYGLHRLLVRYLIALEGLRRDPTPARFDRANDLRGKVQIRIGRNRTLRPTHTPRQVLEKVVRPAREEIFAQLTGRPIPPHKRRPQGELPV